ncbi:MAG TPA: glycosyltransferase family 2 protein [Rudaea sp.]|nr:glycosyltransferase family 2 protein [Rudaea sp.]
MNSLVIPVYRNEGSVPALLDAMRALAQRVAGLEVVFVVDGSPDRSYACLREALPELPFPTQLIAHSRNFGSFAAIRTGLAAARGERFATMAADLQEPIELAEELFARLARDEADVLVGTRDGRADPLGSRIGSATFWWLYRHLINAEIPPGGVDVFACNRTFRDQLLALEEQHSSLIGLLFWVGFRRGTVSYTRRERQHGRSAWTFRRKLKYMMDSVFAFSDLPIRLLLVAGTLGLVVAVLLGFIVLGLRMRGGVAVPGYAATMITIVFFGGLNAFGLGLLGAYLWRAFANTQRRPLAIVMRSESFAGQETSGSSAR